MWFSPLGTDVLLPGYLCIKSTVRRTNQYLFNKFPAFPNFLQKQTKPCMPRVFAIVSNKLRAEEGVWRSVLGAVGHRNMLVTNLFAPQSPYLRSGGTEGAVSRGPTLLR